MKKLLTAEVYLKLPNECYNCGYRVLDTNHRREIPEYVWYPYSPPGSNNIIGIKFCLECNLFMNEDIAKVQMMYMNGKGTKCDKLFSIPSDNESYCHNCHYPIASPDNRWRESLPPGISKAFCYLCWSDPEHMIELCSSCDSLMNEDIAEVQMMYMNGGGSKGKLFSIPFKARDEILAGIFLDEQKRFLRDNA